MLLQKKKKNRSNDKQNMLKTEQYEPPAVM